MILAQTKATIMAKQEYFQLIDRGYFAVVPELVEKIPLESSICIVTIGVATFTPGILQNMYKKDGNIVLVVSDRHYTLSEKSIVWKKYQTDVFAEMYTINASLLHKKQQIEDLTNRIEKLESILSKKY